MSVPLEIRIFSVMLFGAIFIGLTGGGTAIALAQQSEIRASLGYLQSHQDTVSGGIREVGQDSVSPVVSGWSSIAFSAAGFDTASPGEPSLDAYIAGTSCQLTAVTDIERAILVVSAEGKNPRNYGGCNLAVKLENNIDAISGIIGSDIVSTIFGVLALSSYDAAIPDNTISFIVSQQKVDGGWDSGWGTEANITAQAIMALAASDFDLQSPAIVNAKQYLKNLQTDIGGIKYDANAWTTASDAFSDAYSVQALYALNETPYDTYWLFNGLTILDDLASLRQTDGSYNFSSLWGAMNPVWTTAVVIPALSGKPLGWQGNNLAPFDETALPSPIPEIEVSSALAATLTPTNTTIAPLANTNVSSQAPQDTILNTMVANNANESLSLSAEIPAVATDNIPTSGTSETIMGAVDEPPADPTTPVKIPLLIVLVIGGLSLGTALSIAWRKYTKVLVLVLLLFASSIIPSTTLAARAGIVVRHAIGDTKRSCVNFSETSITGIELLSRANMHPILDNGFVVEINDERAKSFSDAGVKDDYWSYWLVDNTKWQYSPLGATYKRVHDGEVNGWQRGGSSLLITPITFDQICPPVETAPVANTQPPADTPVLSQANTAPLVTSNTNNSKISPKTDASVTPALENATPALAQNTSPTPSLVAGISTKNITLKSSDYFVVLIIAASILSGFLLHRAYLHRFNQKHTS